MRAHPASLALLGLLSCAVALAQPSRPGMRLRVTRVAPRGGFTADGLLVVHASTVVRAPASDCGPGATRIDAAGQDARGRIRRAHVEVVAVAGGRSAGIGPGSCDAHVELTLDDGQILTLTRGSVRASLVAGSGLDAAVEGSVIDDAGVPTTVTGHIVLSPAS